jgi:hypothetical protein
MNFGVAKSISASAPEPLSFAICETTSVVVSSYGSEATIFGPLPATARERPRAMSLPSSVFSNSTATFAFGRVLTRSRPSTAPSPR